MSVIKLNTSLLGKACPLEFSPSFFCMRFMPSQNILKRCWNEEILLLQPQLFSSLGRIIGIKNTSYILSSLPRLKSIKILAFVKREEVKFINRKWFPEPQAYRIESRVTRNRSIVSSSNYSLTILPIRPLNSFIIDCFPDFSVKVNFILDIHTLNFPRVSVTQPVIRHLNLEAIFNDLLEDSIIVSYTVTPSWKV
jgi:hypothetical protein